MRKVPADATPELRWKMYLEAQDELVRLNQSYFLPIGVRRRWWKPSHWLMVEHPRTTLLEDWKEFFEKQTQLDKAAATLSESKGDE